MSVVELKVAPKHKPPNAELISRLEDALEKAKSGDCQSVVMILELTDGYEQHTFTTGVDRTVLLGMLSRMEYRLHKSLDRDVVDVE